ncbi:queuosine precursor transporter [Cysteiniphilum marinum]|uniref:queuosine precursor transporter n=1 Tax=Cysteiniphilum marinum TaxID=2774191 RepID=UPI002E293488|nr:queuosine precursor transporter [Cysteiniphilum marinum]
MARKIIFVAMLPASTMSYVVANIFLNGHYIGISSLLSFNPFVVRIVLASFVAFVIGQLMDILIFNQLRQSNKWWSAPLPSTALGVFIDSVVLFSIAFYQSSNPFMAQHWIEIAIVDTVFKFALNVILMLPLYRICLILISPYKFKKLSLSKFKKLLQNARLYCLKFDL